MQRTDPGIGSINSRVIVRLTSGLGNQLFQYACGLALARRKGAELKFDTTWFQLVASLHRPVRSLRIQELGLPIAEEFTGIRRLIVGMAAAAFDGFRQGKVFVQQLAKAQLIQEASPLKKHTWGKQAETSRVYLNGYWQTSDHFLAVHEELQRKIRSRPLTSSGAQDLNLRIRRRQSGFIHIRRGDYTTLVGETGLLPGQYYENAVERIGDSGLHWFVFSEDGDWARSNLGFLRSWELVNYESGNRDTEDLQLMAACDAGIIANSSYSWWGAAIGDRRDRPIIAPDRYWRTADWTTREWVLPNWKVIEAWS